MDRPVVRDADEERLAVDTHDANEAEGRVVVEAARGSVGRCAIGPRRD
jgi:hypothetical protein